MIHRYEQNGFFIVLDVHSGAVHVLDEMTYEMTGLLKAPMPKECPARRAGTQVRGGQAQGSLRGAVYPL